MKRRRHWVGSVLLPILVLGMGVGLAAWKYDAIQDGQMASAKQPEPMETVTVAVAKEIEHRQTTTSIGTVLALRSITLRNELAGTVRDVRLVSGQIVEAGTVLVALDVSVEEAELKAQEAKFESRVGDHAGRSRPRPGRSGCRPGPNRPHQGHHCA